MVDLRATCTLSSRPSNKVCHQIDPDTAEQLSDGSLCDVYSDYGNPSFPSALSTSASTDLVTVTCKGSTRPFRLPASRLTKHSRLFSTLSCCPETTTAPNPSTHLPSTIDLNIDYESFIVFARFLSGGPVHLPPGAVDKDGYGTDIYTLMHAHAAGEALQAPVFTDMVMDAIIEELTTDDFHFALPEKDIAILDAKAKATDLDLLLPAACLTFPPNSIGRNFFIDWYVHEPAHRFYNLSIASAVETGDLDFLARCMVGQRDMRVPEELGEEVVPPYVEDPCRYHVHGSMGLPCYRRGRRGRYSGVEYAVRLGLGKGEEDDECGVSEVAVEDYEDCVDEASLMLVDEGVCDC